MTELRNVTINARTRTDAGGPLWAAQIVVGLLNRPADQDVPKGAPHDTFRAGALRVVLQDTDSAAITLNRKTTSGYHSPRLIQAAVRACDTKNDSGQQTSVLSVYGGGDPWWLAGKAELDPRIGSIPAPYSDVLLGLNDTIKTKSGNEIELPELTLEGGAIATLLRIDAGDVAGWFGITSGSPYKIFGRRSSFTIAPTEIGNVRYLPVWLVPDGIEFESSFADPFAAAVADRALAPAPLKLRMLLTYEGELSQFMLRPRAAGAIKADTERLRASFDALMQVFGGKGAPLLAEVEPRGLPFSWSLGSGTPDNATLDATASLAFIDRKAIRVRLNSEAPDGSAIPTVCQLKVRSARIATADRKLSISCDSSADMPDLAVAAAPADDLVMATVSWVDANPGSVSLKPGKTAPQVIDTGEFEKRVRARYDAAGLKLDPRKAVYVFLPLERGMLQAPLPVPPSLEEKRAEPDDSNRSAFSGLIRSRMPMGENRDAASVEVTAAIGAEIVVSLAGTATTTATFTGARGTATGLLFAAAASPSPTSILPPLDAGPIACEPLDIVFGDPQAFSTLSVRTWDIATVSGHPTRLSIAIVLSAGAGEAIVWRSHPRMALVSTMPMTRTRFDATRPSTTRDLVPFTVASGKAREFALRTVLDDPNRSPFPDLVSLPSVPIVSDPVWPWPNPSDDADTGEANNAIANVSASALTLPGIEMTLDAPDWGKLKASLRYDLPILGELFASATLPKAPAPGSPQPDDMPEHAPTALEPKALTDHWILTANRHALSRTINDRATDWFTPGAAPSAKPMTTFIEPYTFIPTFTVAMDSAGLPLGSYGLFGTTVAGNSALAGWSGRLTSQQAVAVDIVGFSARLYAGKAGGKDAQVDTRGVGQAFLPLTRSLVPQGLVELRNIIRLDTVDGAVRPNDRVSLTAAHIGFRFAGMDNCGLRLRDLPMTVDGQGNLSFAPTVTTADHSRRLTGPEGNVGPDGSVFERQQLSDAVFEWSFYRISEPPSFVLRLGSLNLRPLRLVSVSFANETTDLRLSGFEMIANVEPPTSPACSGGPIDDDAPYSAGDPVAFSFTLAAGEATLVAIHPVSVQDRTILIGTANVAVVSFPAVADLNYGAVDAELADSSTSRAHGKLPIVLEMSIQASGARTAPITIGSAAVNAVLFGSPVRIPFSKVSLSTDTLTFEYRAPVAPPTQFEVPRVGLTWKRGVPPVLLLCARLRLPGAVVAAALPTGLSRDLVDWQIGAPLRWFGTKLSRREVVADGDYFSFDVDHNKGTLNLSILIKSLPEQAAFIQGWSVTGVPFTLGLAVAFAAPMASALFPAVPSAGFVEVTCGAPDGLFIRHRSIAPGQLETRTSRIVVSLPNLALTSAIAWPLDGLSATFPGPFAPNSRVAADWRQDIKVVATNAHAHNVTLAVRDAELSAVNLFESGGAVRLGAPWLFPALATHTLRGSSNSLTWTSVDEIVVGHVSSLEREAAETLNTPPGELAFVARYRDSVPSYLQAFAVSAAVFSKAMARAGIPTLELLISLGLAQKARAASGSSDATSAGANDIFISGAALIEVGAEKDHTLGHRVVTPWIAPLFPGNALGILSNIPQAPWNGQVSTYDLAPYTVSRLDLESAVQFGTSDASIAWIKRFRERIAGSLPQQQIPTFESVSQGIIEDTELPSDGADPAHWLNRPIWLRTLAAWKGILDSTRAQPLADRVVTLTPITVGDQKTSLRTTAVRLALRRSVSDQPVGAKAVADTGQTWQSGSIYEVIVLTRNAVAVVAVTNDDARTLNESQQLMDGEERNRLAQLAFSVPDEPLAAALGQLTDVPASLLTVDQKYSRTHRVSGFLELPAYFDAVQQPHRLRDRKRTVYPSAAIAWPRAAVRAGWNGVAQPAALALGDQRPLQDAQYSWAGEAHSFSVTGAAPAMEADAIFRQASVLTIGQRALFRRPVDEDLTAPPDRALAPVPSRARVPNAQSIELALKPLRLRKTDSKPEGAIASIQPTHFEIVATGRRPGVLFFQYDGLSFADGDQSFDTHQPRFGRPADRGPVVFRQTRAPRSTAYQPMDDLSRRRQTFIGSDYLDAGSHLMPFVLAKGSMTALRILSGDGSAAAAEVILLRLARPDASTLSISGGWNGTLMLTATLYAADASAAVARLTAIGLTTPDTRMVLVINGREFAFPAFPAPVVGVASENPHYKPHGNPMRTAFDVPITLSLTPSNTALAQGVLQSADSDSSASLAISLPVPVPRAPSGIISDLQRGPPRLLSIPMPIAACRKPSLRIETATLAFGDPAYDREISSKTASASQQVDGKPYLLALDRLEYDLSASIYFAAGVVIKTSLNDPVGADPVWGAPEQMTLQLGVLRKATPGTVRPAPLVVAGCQILDGDFPPQHRFGSGEAYAIALADLRQVVPNKKDDWKGGYMLQAPLPALVAGDRIVVTAIWPKGSMEVAVTIVADPVLSPPAAVYGLATLDQDGDGAKRLTSSFFASAPLPQIVEFQDLAGDLVKGLVRRRALFVWPFFMRNTPPDGNPYGALVKFDRTGGGQLPNSEADFHPLLA